MACRSRNWLAIRRTCKRQRSNLETQRVLGHAERPLGFTRVEDSVQNYHGRFKPEQHQRLNLRKEEPGKRQECQATLDRRVHETRLPD